LAPKLYRDHRGDITRGRIQTLVPLKNVGGKSRSFWGILLYNIFFSPKRTWVPAV